MHLLDKLTNKKIFALLVIVGITVHISVFGNGFVGDDSEQIYNLVLVKGFSEIWRVFSVHHAVLGSEHGILGGYYKPLMLFYFYSVREIFGYNPFFYHAPQVILCIINAYLVFLLFVKFFKKYWAVLLSVLYLIHPINQEVVAYVSNIQEVLFFLFGISALLISTRKKLSNKNYITIVCLLLLSLLSKESGILFVVITVMYIFLFRRKEILKVLLSSSVTLVLYFLLRFSSKGTNAFWIEPPPMASVDLQARLQHIPSLFFYYIQTFFYPNVLSFNQQWVIHIFDFGNHTLPLFLSIIFCITLFGLILYAFKKNFKEKVVLLFFVLWFFLGIVPHMQLLPLDATVATRWFYFSSVGIIGILGVLLGLLDKKHKLKQACFVIFIFVLVILSIRTMMRNTQWRSAFLLYSTDSSISKSPLLENNLGDEYFKMGNTKQALVHFKKAVALSPDLWIGINNLGIIEEKKGNLLLAERYYKKAYEKGHRLPVAENVSRILLLNGKRDEAEKFIIPTLKEYPYSSKLWLTLALTYYEKQDYKKALSPAEKSYTLLPDPKTLSVITAIQEKLR